MQANFKSIVSRAFGQSVPAAGSTREIGAPQTLPAHLLGFVAGGAPKSGWSIAAPKSGWSIEAPKSGW